MMMGRLLALLDLMSGMIIANLNNILARWTLAWNAVRDLAVIVWNYIKDYVTNTFNDIRNFIGSVLEGIKSIWNGSWEAVKNKATEILLRLLIR